MATKKMQAADQIRSWTGRAAEAFAWARAHARLVAGAALAIAALLWLAGHDAQLRRDTELGQIRRETAAEVAALRARADGAMKELRANERLIRDLESRGAKLEHEAAILRARLNFLREEELARVRAAAAPGHNKLAGHTSPRPDPARGEAENSSSHGAHSGTGSGGEAESEISDLRFEKSKWHKLQIQHSEFQTGTGGATEMDSGALASCREQSAVQDALIANCEERVEINRAALEAAKRSALELGGAMRAKDEIAARIEAKHRAELKAARGSRLRRFGRALEYVGVGVVIGIAVAQ